MQLNSGGQDVPEGRYDGRGGPSPGPHQPMQPTACLLCQLFRHAGSIE